MHSSALLKPFFDPIEVLHISSTQLLLNSHSEFGFLV